MVTSRKSMIRNAESMFNPVVASPNIKLKLFDTADIEKSLRDLRIKTSAWKSGNISRNRYIVLFHMTVALDAAFLLMIEINVFIQPLVTTFLRLLASKGCKKIKTGDSVIFQHDSRFVLLDFLSWSIIAVKWRQWFQVDTSFENGQYVRTYFFIKRRA